MVREAVKTNPNDNREHTASTNRPIPNSGSVVLGEGHHFIVVHDAKVVVDHVFSASPSPKPSSIVSSSLSTGSVVLGNVSGAAPLASSSGAAPTPTPQSHPAKGALSFKLGPLAIDAVSLQFKESGDGKAKTLSIIMDAIFTMGPIVFSLLGFGIHFQLSGGITLDNLQDVIKTLTVSLEGLARAFSRPPLLIAGVFQHQVIKTADATQDIYLGGIGVSFPPHTFVGLGEYASIEILAGSGQSYKSVFLFAKLDGPLVTLEFATISGVRLGLGYNSMVRSPTIDELTQFPFINDHSISGVSNDLMALLKSMVNPKDTTSPAWVSPKLDSYWFAADTSITAFDLLTVTAVAMLAFRDSGLVASIYADAVAMMPPDVPKEAVIVYAEIGMTAEMNFVDGYFRVEAALAPTSTPIVSSFLNIEQPSDHAGDFVFSIGGYHGSYDPPPPWYPVPKHLGISFNIDIISITGELYFAVTPKCAMGGALIHASLAFGPISAWLDATLDALVQFHPLHYTADFSVSIGVTFDADILFIHIHVEAIIRADLHIEGVEFGGRAHVDFYLFAFDVDFGASPQRPPPLDLFQFWSMLHKADPESGGSNTTQIHQSLVNSFLQYSFVSADPDHAKGPQTVSGAAFKYVLENGNFPLPSKRDDSTSDPKSTGAGEKWYVKGGSFQFRIASDFATSDANVVLGSESIQKLIDAVKASGKAAPTAPFLRQVDPSKHEIFSKPMHASSKITSTLAVKVTYTNTGESIDQWDEIQLIEKDVPTAIWDRYDAASDPGLRPQSLLNGNNATIKQCMSLLFKAPPPELCPPATAKGFIPKFNAAAAMRMGILDFRVDTVNGTAWIKKHSEPLQTQYLPTALTDKEQTQTNKERWSSVRDSWKGLSTKRGVVNDPTNGLLTLFAKTVAWDKQRPQTEVAPTTATPAMTVDPSPSKSSAPGASSTSVAPAGTPASTIAATPSQPAPTTPARPPWQLTDALPPS